MRLIALLLVILAGPIPSFAQETDPPEGTRINSAQVSGFELTRLSPGLQAEIGKLAGTPLNRQVLRDLAARLEEEQPRYVTAVRTGQDPDGGARVTFVVARIRAQTGDADINSKYVVDEVEVRGVPDRDVSPTLRQEMQALVGKPLDSDAAERIANQLRAAFPSYELQQRTVRATQPRRIRIIYSLDRPDWARWLRYEPIDANAVYHSDQGWGALLPLMIGSRNVRVTPIVAWDTADGLIEEYSGFGLRIESRRIGTDRLGMFFEWSTYDQDWRDRTLATLALNPQLPGPYRNRMSVTPLLKFAFTQHLSVAGGVGITELDPLIEFDPLNEDLRLPSQMANVAIGSLRYRQSWGPAHEIGAAVTLRAGTSGLQSDFAYDRYLGEADYRFRRGRHRILVSGLAGHISGTAPLFERFTLGDSRTLRGWDKYDIAPAGGDRMFHTSFEYRVHDVLLFVDGGSVWDTGASKRVRFSTGVGFAPGPAFFTVGFPLNTDEFRAVFTMGFRFGSSSAGIRKQ